MNDKPKRKAPAPRPYHKGNVASDLTEVAARLLETETFEDVTVRRLCREVGVTPGNFYNHFESLDDLLLDIAADAFEQHAVSTRRVIDRAPSRGEAVVTLTVDLVEFGHANPQLFRVMFGQIPNASVQKHQRYQAASQAGFGLLVEAIYGENIFRPDEIAWSHEHCSKAYALFAYGYGLARLISMRQITFGAKARAERRRFVESMARTFVLGLDLEGKPAANPAKPAKLGKLAKTALESPVRKSS